MAERDIETSLVHTLRTAQDMPERLAYIPIVGSTSDAVTLADLCRDIPFDIVQNDSQWNPYPGFMEDVIGGMTPDIVIRSRASKQNRIYVEVKETSPMNYGTHDSQVIRYFLHLLATSKRRAPGPTDIRRAVLVAAPPTWFNSSRTGTDWKYFIERYTDLAKAFDITLGEVRVSA